MLTPSGVFASGNPNVATPMNVPKATLTVALFERNAFRLRESKDAAVAVKRVAVPGPWQVVLDRKSVV